MAAATSNVAPWASQTAKDGRTVRFYLTVVVLPPSVVDLPGANKAGQIAIHVSSTVQEWNFQCTLSPT